MRPAFCRRVWLRLISLVIAISLFAATQPDHAQSGSVDVATALGTSRDTRAVPALIEARLAAEPGKDPRAIKPLQEVAQKNVWAQNEARAALLAMGASP